jgi:predicted RNase H-like HicB family nuclease
VTTDRAKLYIEATINDYIAKLAEMQTELDAFKARCGVFVDATLVHAPASTEGGMMKLRMTRNYGFYIAELDGLPGVSGMGRTEAAAVANLRARLDGLERRALEEIDLLREAKAALMESEHA